MLGATLGTSPPTWRGSGWSTLSRTRETISKASRERSEGRILDLLREIALIAVLAGAAGSLVFLLSVGRRSPRFLLVFYVFWVLSPFTVLVWANLVSKRWSVVTRATLYSVMLILALSSLVIYRAVSLGLFRARPAAVFLLVPLASWLFTAIAVPIAALTSRRLSRRGDGA